MSAKKTEESSESLENTMGRMGDIFDTPRSRCLQLKAEFLRKARDYTFWGRDNSKQRVIALDTLLQYCNQSMELAELGTELRKDVHLDIKNFLLKDHVLPVPRSVRARLCSTVDDYAKTEAQEIAFMMADLYDLHKTALTEFEKEEWSLLDKFNEKSNDLRVLRKAIYTMKWSDDQDLFDHIRIQAYEHDVSHFLKTFKQMLSRREVFIWKKKLKDTQKYAEGLMMSDKEESTNVVENTSKSIVINPHVPEVTLEKESVVHEAQEIFEAAKLQESLTENLPDVPVDEIFDNQSSVADAHIEARLLKLKFFRKTWCSADLAGKTEPKNRPPTEVIRLSKPERKSEMVKDVPIYSTKEETERFNNWYLQKIGDNSNTSQNALTNEVQATKTVSEQDDKTAMPASGAYSHIDKDVDDDYAKNLSSTCTRNFFEGFTSLPSYSYMVNMLVLFLAILKLINFSSHKLSYVPAVFPTQPQPYPEPDPSVPSSAHGHMLATMERRLTRTSSYMAKGYLSRLRDTVWEMVHQGRIMAGLRIIQVGEILLP